MSTVSAAATFEFENYAPVTSLQGTLGKPATIFGAHRINRTPINSRTPCIIVCKETTTIEKSDMIGSTPSCVGGTRTQDLPNSNGQLFFLFHII